ncbi:MAG: glycoside hydrolase family 9 protein, partial [Phycisphaerae bacterium]|nr:glycoside hydrolase family 9 protein [Phycisphaerae bacterium]
YLAASAGAMAYRVLKDRDPDRAARALHIAKDDWAHAIVGEETPETQSTPAFAATEMELAAVGILASLELYQVTGDRRYAEKARELAGVVVNSQQKSYVGDKFPLAGFFYTSPAKTDIFYQFHRGSDQAPIVAMAKLCEAFPEHADWMQWYTVVALYSEYQKASSVMTEPYGVLPAYVYRESDSKRIAEGDRYASSRAAYREQVLQGMPMGDGYYLKAFPVWFSRRGNYGVLLSQAKGLSAAAHLRGDLAAAELAQRQLQWVVGRNPFAQSTMWGEGYDFAQQYSVSSGDLVGSLPVGMLTRGNRDVPFWPPRNGYVYKEVWVHPSARWFWLMQDLFGAALVEGRVPPGAASTVTFEHQLTGQVHAIEADVATGRFHDFVPEGDYRVRCSDYQTHVTLLPAGMHTIDFGPGHFVHFSLSAETMADDQLRLRLTATGVGGHRFAVRTYNLTPALPEQEVELEPGTPVEVTWTARIESTSTPWVTVVIPDDDISQRRELYGAALISSMSSR